MNRKKKIAAYVIASIVLSAVCIFLFYTFFYEHRFNFVNNVIINKDYKIIVDEDTEEINFFKTKDDHVISEISFDKVIDNKGVSVLNYYVYNDDVYICNVYIELGKAEENYEIYLLDFENNRAVKKAAFLSEDIYDMIYRKGLGVMDYGYFTSFYIRDGIIHTVYTALTSDEEYPDTLYSYLVTFDCEDDKWRLAEAEYVVNSSDEIYNIGNEFFYIDNYNLLFYKGNDYSLSDDEYLRLYRIDETSFIGQNITRMGYDLIDLENMEISPMTGLDNITEAENIGFSDIRCIDSYEERMAIAVYNDKNAYIIDSDGQNARFVYSVRTLSFKVFILICIALLFIPAVLLGVISVYWTAVVRRQVILKIITLIIPFMIICDIGAYFITSKYFEKKNHDMLVDSLNLVGQQYSSLKYTENIGDFSDLSDPDNEDLEYIAKLLINVVYSYLGAYQSSMAGNNSSIIQVGYVGIDKKENSYISMLDNIGMNNELLYESAFNEYFKNTVQSGNTGIYETYNFYNDSVIYMIYPTRNNNNEINGAYLFSAQKLDTSYELDKLMDKILWYEMFLSFDIIAVFLIVMAISLYPLKRLKMKAVNFTSDGKYEFDKKTDNRKYVDEISVISEKFDDLALSVKDNLYEINKLRLTSKAYFSDEILKLLGRKSVSLLDFTENTRKELYVLTVYLTPDYSEFGCINELVKELSQQIEEYKAFISYIDSCKIMILSESSDLINEAFYLRQRDENIHMVFDRCLVDISVVGSGESYSFSMTCTDRTRAEILSEYYDKTRSALVVTDNSFNNNASNFTANCIGIIDNEYIYEISINAGDNILKLTRDTMKKGVELYYRGEYKKAREQFVLTLINNRNDPAARYYINLIDNI